MYTRLTAADFCLYQQMAERLAAEHNTGRFAERRAEPHAAAPEHSDADFCYKQNLLNEVLN